MLAKLFIFYVLLSGHILHAQEVKNPLPDAYSGTAVITMQTGPESEWKIGSKQLFATSRHWDMTSASLYHGEDLGYTPTNYNYSSLTETFRYNYQGSMKTIGHIQEGLIDRNPFVSPQKGYDLLLNSEQAPIETLDDGLTVYTRNDHLGSGQLTYIAVDPETGEIHWMENRAADKSSLNRFLYTDWKPFGNGRSVPTLIRFDPDTIYEARMRITEIEVLTNTNPPRPKSLGDQYVIHDVQKGEAFYPNGDFLGKDQVATQASPTKKLINSQTLITGIGVLLVLTSGILIAKRRAGSQ